MVTYAIPLWLIISTLILILAFMLISFYFIWLYYKRYLLDNIMMVDKNNRWKLHNIAIKDRNTFTHKEKTYHLNADTGLLNHKGKAFYVFSENNPTPLSIEHNKVKWLDAKSLTAVINNKLVQEIVKPRAKMLDTMIILSFIASIIAALSGIVLLLIQTGVISSVTSSV